MYSLKVLIVDDELPIREEFAAFPWNNYGCTCIGTAKNGKEALQFCAEFTPDVVITDIAMPAMNGLDLTRELKTSYPNIQVVILTGHRDFEYAKTALKLDVLDYIEKMDMCENEIASVIAKAQEQLAVSGAMSSSMVQDLKAKTEKTMLHILKAKNENCSPTASQLERLRNYLTSLGIIPSSHHCFFLNTGVLDVHTSMIDTITSEYLEATQLNLQWSKVVPGTFAVNPAKLPLQDMDGFLNELVDGLKQHLTSFIDIPCPFIVVYPQAITVETLLRYLEERSKWSQTHFYAADAAIFAANQLIQTQLITPQSENGLTEVFRLLEHSQTSFTSAFQVWINLQHPDVEPLKIQIAERVREYYWRHEKKYSMKLAISIMEAGTVTELIEIVLQECGTDVQYRHEIGGAIRLIQECYHMDLTLTDVADKVALSPQYLSRLFREQTGETFNDYLTRIRIEHAQQLVFEGKHKIYEIAGMVGIPNYRYFSALYRKWTGFSPKMTKRKNDNE